MAGILKCTQSAAITTNIIGVITTISIVTIAIAVIVSVIMKGAATTVIARAMVRGCKWVALSLIDIWEGCNITLPILTGTVAIIVTISITVLRRLRQYLVALRI